MINPFAGSNIAAPRKRSPLVPPSQGLDIRTVYEGITAFRRQFRMFAETACPHLLYGDYTTRAHAVKSSSKTSASPGHGALAESSRCGFPRQRCKMF